jgi:hypothetical protein
MLTQDQEIWRKLICAFPVILSVALSACGGSGSSGASVTPNTNADGETLSSKTIGYTIPTKISAVPENKSIMHAARLSAYPAAVAAGDLPATSDYAQAIPRRYIEEHSLEQFDILEQVLSAFDQTHFADAENINAGPYKAMIAWEDEKDGRAVKQLEPWVVDSRMIVDDQGRDVNRVLVWIEEPNSDAPDGKKHIKAEAKIYQSATIDADGNITDYGEWVMNVSFDDSPDNFFTASSSYENGVNVLKVQDHFVEGPPDNPMVMTMKGVLYRDGTNGYGQVQYPDWESCWTSSTPNCAPQTITAQYAYNDNYLAVQQGSDPAVYRDRASTTEMTHQYGLFYKDTDAVNGITEGDSLEKHRSFGFPVTYTDSNGIVQHAYYGAWQGRHELWGSGPSGQIPAGTTVTEEAFGANTPASYTVSALFNGTFTRRTLSDADLNAIKGIPVETWINNNYELTFDTGAWKFCDGNTVWVMGSRECHDRVTDAVIALTPFTDFASLAISQGGRKHVNINRWDNIAMQNYDYVYLTADPVIAGFTFSGTGFYEATWDGNGNLAPNTPAAMYTPINGDNIWVNIGGSIYIQYTGDFTSGKTGWVEKQLTSFIEQTWTPVFADSSFDVNFSPEQGNEYYINNQGANYIVRRVNSADAPTSYEVKSELQTSANPVNYAGLLPTGTSFLRTPWRPDVKFTLVTDSANPNFLQLIYLTDDPNTANVDESAVPTVYTSGEWGLQAFNVSNQPLTADGTPVTVDEWGFPAAGQPRPVEFNWEYSTNGWGTQQFLLDGSGAYVVLSDPIQLLPLSATNGAGTTEVLSLAFDGWMHGMPDMYFELSKNNWIMTQEISDKIINLPAATVVTDVSGVSYFVKPLDISLFLDTVTTADITSAGGTVPDITNASQADLTTVPDLVPHGMGAMPTGTVVKYSEGIPVN